jgi:dGTP triphosphohydrolase
MAANNFLIKKKVCSDYEGYSFLAKLHHDLCVLEQETIVLDFKDNTWFEANLCAALGAIINKASNNFNHILLSNLNNQLESIFSRNHFLASFGGYQIEDFNNTTIKYRRNKIQEDKLIKEFLDKELIDKPDFPRLSIAARSEIIRSIFEIYSNAVIHGACDYVYSCGQFYPNKRPPRIDFTIVDIGRTIKGNVAEFLGQEVSGLKAIEWALKENNTTKPKENNIPGGLGLKIIRDFTRLNNGKLQIVSSDGFWQLSHGQEQSLKLNNSFPGTLVNLEFNLDDQSFYYLTEEKPEDIIF